MKIILAIIFVTALKTAYGQSFNATVFCSTRFSGRFPHPNSANCSQYVKCYPYNGNLLGAVYSCFGTTVFDGATASCKDGAICVPPSTTTSTTTTTTPTTTVSTTTVQPFNATVFCAQQVVQAGNYPYTSGCVNYIKCYPYNGTLLGAVYSCLGTTFFDPALRTCTDKYSC